MGNRQTVPERLHFSYFSPKSQPFTTCILTHHVCGNSTKSSLAAALNAQRRRKSGHGSGAIQRDPRRVAVDATHQPAQHIPGADLNELCDSVGQQALDAFRPAHR